MILALDAGNTQIVAGVFSTDGRLDASWRLPSRRDATSDELAVLLRGVLGARLDALGDCVLGSVVPPLTPLLVDAIGALGLPPPLVIAPGIKTGLVVRTDNPLEVGADRIVNAVAAHARTDGPVVVVDFGTATTFDVVTGSGEYLGGVITAGPEICADALSRRAARLPRVDLTPPARVVGRNTLDSIRSGLIHGHAAMAEGVVNRIEAELDTRVRVIATGGSAPILAPLMARVDEVDRDLTLTGLFLVHRRNRGR